MKHYGTLRLDRTSRRWEISNLEPHVSIRFKHMFPRVPKQSVGPFFLPFDLLTCADLQWFTSRYPLSVCPYDLEALQEGRLGFETLQAEMERILLPEYQPKPWVGLKEGAIVRKYQAQAVEILIRRKFVLLGDEGGLGKTYVAGAFLCSEGKSLPAAVVCDPHTQRQWRDKLTHFTNLKIHLIKKARPYSLPPADVYIFRVTQISGWTEIFNQRFFKAAVYDEPQSLRRGTESNKGAAARVLSDNVDYILGLTATPIYNYGVEMWNVMSFIDPSVLGSYEDFHREWVDSSGRIKDPKALGTFLREQHALIRRLKSDVGLELPKVSRIVEHVSYDNKAVESVDEMAQRLAIRASTGSFVERGQAARELDMLVRQATGVSKAKSVAQFVRLMVEAGEPVLLMGWHRAVYDIWLEELKDFRPAMYTGSETASKKNGELNRFLDGDTDVLIMSLRSGAGTDGLQHRCSVVVFGELDWSPGIHQQVIWRLDRDGQEDPVSAFFLVSEEGSDPPIMDVLGIKASEANQIVDPNVGVEVVEEDLTNLQKLVARYLEKCKRGPTQTAGSFSSATEALSPEGAMESINATVSSQQVDLFEPT